MTPSFHKQKGYYKVKQLVKSLWIIIIKKIRLIQPDRNSKKFLVFHIDFNNYCQEMDR